MHHEPEIRLVVTHSECRRGHQCLDFVAQERVLEGVAAVGVELPGVRGDRIVRALHGPDGLDEPVGVGDGEHVDDARARQCGQVSGRPGVPLHRR